MVFATPTRLSGELRGKPISIPHGGDEIDSSRAEQKEERKDGGRVTSGYLCRSGNCLFVLAVHNISVSYREGCFIQKWKQNASVSRET